MIMSLETEPVLRVPVEQRTVVDDGVDQGDRLPRRDG
jgi:hypothetical protein